ncbi:MAG: hypothetical protein J1F36_01040 [Clostridiales bacterium]|nr:hypothetical protein [Clostridiales bacterium]
MDELKFKGTETQVCKKLVKAGIGKDENEAKQFLNNLIRNKQILSDSESANMEYYFSSGSYNPGVHYFMTPSYNYYISVKFTTIFIIATIFDITLTKGFVSSATSFLGIQKQGIVKLDENNGEKCIAKQTALTKNKIGTQDILSENNGQCCNKNFKCQFNIEGICHCDNSNIITIYENLTQKGVFKKHENKYKFNF